MGLLGYLQGQRVADVSSQASIVACLTEDVVDKRGGGGLTVRASNTNHLGISITTSKLYLADDVDALLDGLADHWGGIGNAGRLDNLVGGQYLILGMLTFLPRYLVVVHQLLVFIRNLRHVRDEHVETFFLSQYGGSCATLSSS